MLSIAVAGHQHVLVLLMHSAREEYAGQIRHGSVLTPTLLGLQYVPPAAMLEYVHAHQRWKEANFTARN